MKYAVTHVRWLIISFVFVLFIVLIDACKKDASIAPINVASFSPSSGVAGATVTVTGTNFGATIAENTVKFNGAEAIITDASSTGLTVILPGDATSGTVSVTANGVTGTSNDSFAVLAPTVTGFFPNVAAPNIPVIITGTNFSTTLAFDDVQFNGISGTVTAATSTQITATVPAGTTSGKITVRVGTGTITTSDDFEACSGAVELIAYNVTISGIAGDRGSFNYAFDLINSGSSSADLTKFSVQGYASTDNVKSNDDLAASGWTMSDGTGGPSTLPSNATSHFQFTSNINGGTVDDHPYLIFVISSGTVTECNIANNIVVKSILN